MDASALDMFRLSSLIPDGIPAGTDRSSIVAGTLLGIDIDAGQVQVSVAGSEPVWVPAHPSIYEPSSRVRIRRSVVNGGRLEFCEGPISPGPAVVTGTIVSVGDDLIEVETLGSSYELPFVSSTYDPGDPVLVLRHPGRFGIPQTVLGIAGEDRPTPTPGGGTTNPGQTQSRQAVISPQDSGTFKVAQSRWDSWNTDRYGGIAALWQGNAYGSGQLIGWAGYGEQVMNLHASSVEKIWVDVVRSDSSVTSGRSVSLRGSSAGTRPGGAPDAVGDAAGSSPMAPGQSQRIELPSSSYEAWRTGGIRGLRTAGSDYLAVFGTSRGGAMALTIQYTVIA